MSGSPFGHGPATMTDCVGGPPGTETVGGNGGGGVVRGGWVVGGGTAGAPVTGPPDGRAVTVNCAMRTAFWLRKPTCCWPWGALSGTWNVTLNVPFTAAA